MKKFVLSAAVFLSVIIGCTSVFAADPTVSVTNYDESMEILYSGGIKNVDAPAIILYINGDVVGDANAVIKNGATLVPLRVISERFGADVSWDGATKTVFIKKNALDVSCTVGESFINVNGEKLETANSTEIIDSKTYIPLRAVSQAYGAQVGYFSDMGENVRIVTVEEKVLNNISEDEAVRIAEVAYFYDFLPSMREYILETKGVDVNDVTKGNIAQKMGFPKYIGKVTHDMGHFWFVEFFEGTGMGALVDKENGTLYPVHSFSMVEYSVSDVGDYSGWGWLYQ